MSRVHIKLLQLISIAAIALTLWFLPKPADLTYQTWHLFAIFITTVIAIIINPLPIGAIAVLSILATIATGTLSVEQSLGAFGASIAWLVVFAFFISRGFIKSGLGKRIAYFLISKIGHSTIGLSYGLILTEFVLSPLIPSASARGGGIIFPIAKSLSEEYGHAGHLKTSKNSTGAFLMQVCFQTNVITSAMFLTSMAANPLIVNLAAQLGVTITWESWAMGAIIPGIISLILLPLIVYIACPPSVKTMKNAPVFAKKALKEMGKISINEIIMLVVFFLMITGWILDKKIGMDAVTVALCGLAILLLTEVLDWSDALGEKGAWDTLIWFATLVMMSTYLAKFGMMGWIETQMQGMISNEHLMISIIILLLFYFYVHYIFASITTHITVLYATFVILLVKLDVPKTLAAMILAYFSSLSGGLTHFGTSTAPIFFGSGYLNTKEWWKSGFLVGLVTLLIWSIIGGAWWHFLGWW